MHHRRPGPFVRVVPARRSADPPTGRPAGRRRRLALLVALVSVLAIGVAVLTGAVPRSATAALDSAASHLAAIKAGVLSARRAHAGAHHAHSTPAIPIPSSGTPSAGAGPTPAPGNAPAPPADPAPGQGATATVPAAITADCSRDVTGALNAWIASVADGSTLDFPAGACYRVDGTLLLSDRHDLTLDGNGARFAASVVPPESPKITRPMWSLVGGSAITIRDMALRGTNPTATYDINREWLPLIQIAGTRTALVDDVHGSHSWGDFVSISPDVRRVTNSDGTGAVLASDVTIRGSSASVIGRHGVSCTGCANVTIDGNTFTDVGYHVFDIEVEASTWYARNIAFTDNTIAGTIKLGVVANAGIGHDVTGVVITGNTTTGTPVSCVQPVLVEATEAVKSDWTVSGNRFKTLGNAFDFAGVNDVTTDGNEVTFLPGGGCSDPGAALVLNHAQGFTADDNDFTGATRLMAAGATVTGTACGNRLTGTAFDQPQACPVS